MQPVVERHREFSEILVGGLPVVEGTVVCVANGVEAVSLGDEEVLREGCSFAVFGRHLRLVEVAVVRNIQVGYRLHLVLFCLVVSTRDILSLKQQVVCPENGCFEKGAFSIPFQPLFESLFRSLLRVTIC